MSDISFKNFLVFTGIEGDVSDEQICEIFGIFRNNSKIEKLKAEREKLKKAKSARGAELDAQLKAFATGTMKGGKQIVSHDDLEAALGSDDRRALAKQDLRSDNERAMIRRKLGLAAESQITEKKITPKDPGWFVVDNVDTPIDGPFQEKGALERAKELNGGRNGTLDSIPKYDVLYFSDYDIKRLRLKEEELDEKLWSGDVKTKKHPPAGLFADGSATKIAAWLKAEHGTGTGAMQALNFYVNRAGANLSSDRKEVMRNVKAMLRSKNEGLTEGVNMKALANEFEDMYDGKWSDTTLDKKLKAFLKDSDVPADKLKAAYDFVYKQLGKSNDWGD